MQGRVVYYNGIYAKVVSTYSDENGLLQFTLDKTLSREALSSVTAQLLFGVTYSNYSHVENKDNVASGTCSHAEGNRTVAAGMNQHVQGKFNLVDLEDKYAHIVGNGANWQNPSNAHTLDWEGNAWFAGDVRVGGTGDTDTNSFSIIPKISTIILSSSSWNITTLQQEVAVTGISADQTSQIITISPDTSCYTEYLDAGAICIGQAENSLTFSVEEIPSSDFTVYVAVQNCR